MHGCISNAFNVSSTYQHDCIYLMSVSDWSSTGLQQQISFQVLVCKLLTSTSANRWSSPHLYDSWNSKKNTTLCSCKCSLYFILLLIIINNIIILVLILSCHNIIFIDFYICKTKINKSERLIDLTTKLYLSQAANILDCVVLTDFLWIRRKRLSPTSCTWSSASRPSLYSSLTRL